MQKRTIAAAGALVALGLAAGGAFTASNTVPTTVAGYGSASVTGANVASIVYSYSADMATITDAKLTFTTDQGTNAVKAAFNADAATTCTPDGSDATGTIFTCAFTQSVQTADDFHVSVSAPTA